MSNPSAGACRTEIVQTIGAVDYGAGDDLCLDGQDGRKARARKLRFEHWCHLYSHRCARTVNLFWVLDRHNRPFPMHFSVRTLRECWQSRKDQRRMMMNAFVRCRSYGSCVPSAYPDYLVAFHCSCGVSLYPFVEVEGPRSLSPGQRPFFREFVRRAGRVCCSHDGRLPKATFAFLALLRVVS